MQDDHVDIKTPEYVSLQFNLAGLGSRAAAIIIDQLILYAVMIVVGIVFVVSLQADLVGDSLWPVAIILIVVFVLQYGYFFVAEFFFAGRTIGKKLMGIRVIQENGHSLTVLTSLIRNLLRIIDMLPSGYFVGIIMVFFHPRHKRIGDLVAGTIVVHERARKKDKRSALDHEIAARGLSADSDLIADIRLNALGEQEWNLMNTYAQRFLQLDAYHRRETTKKLAHAIFPKAGLPDPEQLNTRQMEDRLLTIYLHLKDEWAYEL